MAAGFLYERLTQGRGREHEKFLERQRMDFLLMLDRGGYQGSEKAGRQPVGTTPCHGIVLWSKFLADHHQFR